MFFEALSTPKESTAITVDMKRPQKFTLHYVCDMSEVKQFSVV